MSYFKNLASFLLIVSNFLFFKVNAQNEAIFTESGQYTVPEGVTEVFIEVLGAGGNGVSNGYGGGGGGGYASGIYTVSPGQVLNVTVGIPNNGSIKGTSKVDDLLYATGGESTGWSRGDDGFTYGGNGGMGYGGNISNYAGGNGGMGYWTYYGGGGGGAAGRNGNGRDGGDVHAYDPDGCSSKGGASGASGGYPGGAGSKGAGYLNCDHGQSNWFPATEAGDFGAGGGGGNGSGSPATEGKGGFVRISTSLINLGISQIGLMLHANQENAKYQWVDENFQNINGAVNRSYKVTQPGAYAVIMEFNGNIDTTAFVKFDFNDMLKPTPEIGAELFTKSDSLLVDKPVQSEVWIEVLGAGGSGGGNGYGGGAGGGYSSGIYPISAGKVFQITVGKANGGSSQGTSKVDGLLYATGGENTGGNRDAHGFAPGGTGGMGFDGNLLNYKGGDGGKGYWTYYGGGGGGAAGRDGNGGNGGDVHAYSSDGCSSKGGDAGLSGGYPGGTGSKGAGYLNCGHGSSNWFPATKAGNYGAGGGGGNGSGSPSTPGTDGLVRISYCHIDFRLEQDGLTLTAKQEGASYQWLQIKEDSSFVYLPEATGKSFTMIPGNKYAVLISDDLCAGISDTVRAVEITTNLGLQKNTEVQLTYPNPFSDKINVSGSWDFFELYNSQGVSVWKGKSIQKESFSYLSSGIYTLVMHGEEMKVVKVEKY